MPAVPSQRHPSATEAPGGRGSAALTQCQHPRDRPHHGEPARPGHRRAPHAVAPRDREGAATPIRGPTLRQDPAVGHAHGSQVPACASAVDDARPRCVALRIGHRTAGRGRGPAAVADHPRRSSRPRRCSSVARGARPRRTGAAERARCRCTGRLGPGPARRAARPCTRRGSCQWAAGGAASGTGGATRRAARYRRRAGPADTVGWAHHRRAASGGGRASRCVVGAARAE